MKAIISILVMVSLNVYAKDVRTAAVVNSKMVKAILVGLKQEQNLKCRLTQEEDGQQSVSFYDEDNLSKFRAGFLCDDRRMAIITGVISDGGATATESFSLVFAN